jgi:hypothetical protein
VIQIDANAKNPLVPFPFSLVEPGIKPNLTVTIPTDASSATVTGQTSAFPAQEVNGTVGTATNPLFQFSLRIPRHENYHSELKKIIVPR